MRMTAQQPVPVGWVRQGRRQEWAATTPGWLRVATVAVIALAVVTGAVAGLTALSRSRAVSAARATAEPLVVDAQTAVVKLSDANTTVAGGFLAGPVMPAVAQSRFENDLAQAASSLTAAAQRAGTDRRVTGYLQTLATDLPIYSGIVATAEGDNRQGEPVGAAYLAEANHFMEGALLPAASALYTAEQARLSQDSGRATRAAPVIVIIVLLVLLLAALVYLQAGLARRFRRLLNLGCLAATLAVVALAVWLLVALAGEGGAVSHAEKHGTEPLRVLTQARILASEARADDELTLVTRDADPSYQNDYGSAVARLTGLIGQARSGWTAPETQVDTAAIAALQNYGQAHQTVRAEDEAGRLPTAVADDQLRSSPGAAGLDTTLAGGVDAAVGSFDTSARAAQSDLSGSLWSSVILMVMVVIGVLAGIRPRLREYR
jgi:hypothetical protein